MADFGGYTGKFLDVDLTNQKIEVKEINKKWAEEFIGGKGLGLKILFESIPAKIDPFDPKVPLLFMTGPLTGSRATTSGRWTIVTKSPHTGLYLDSHIGGYFGPQIKYAGYDYIQFTGRSEKPVYLHISANGFDLHDASELWGKTIPDTENKLKEKYPNGHIATIGPAGENKVTFSCIVCDSFHHAGRGGSGAIMGSKNLKAVVVEKGTENLVYVKDEEFREAAKEHRNRIKPLTSERTKLGTPMWVRKSNEGGFLPTKNYQSGVYKDYEDISSEAMHEKIVDKNTACYNCIIKCSKLSSVKEGLYSGTKLKGPEYETIALMGSNCEINSIEAIAWLSFHCTALGIDTITMGNVAAFAMECAERGILTDTEGIDLTFGNPQAVYDLMHKIASREGIGELFARGVRPAALKLGKNSIDFANQVKGLELAGVEPRGSWGMALAYSTSDRGACHQRSWTPGAELSGTIKREDPEGTAKYVKNDQDYQAAKYALVLCDFVPLSSEEAANLLYLATGFNYTAESYLQVGERIWNLARVFNNREGINRKDDIIAKRFMTEPLAEGAQKGAIITPDYFKGMLDSYYEARGWTSEGIPTNEKLIELNLK